jgi:hypothetical protein
MLVATMLDQRASREVSEDDGRVLARKFGVPFAELCALTGLNVDETLAEIVREIRAAYGNPK